MTDQQLPTPGLITEMPEWIRNPTPERLAAVALENAAAEQARFLDFSERQQTHCDLLGQLPIADLIEQTAQPIECDDLMVFTRDEDGEIENPLDIDFVRLGIPESPDGLTPLALLAVWDDDKTFMESIALVGLKEGKVIKLYLEDPTVQPDSESLDLHWQNPSHARLTSEGYSVEKVVDESEVLTTQVTWHSDAELSGFTKPKHMGVIRAEMSADQIELNDVQGADKKTIRLKRVGKVLAGVTLLSAASSMVFQPESKDRAPEAYQVYYSGDAEKAVDANFELFKNGDIEALDEIIAKSEFAKPQIDLEAMSRVVDASNFDELDKAMDGALSHLDISFTVRHDDKQNVYDAVPDNSFNDARSSAAGILDAINELGIIVEQGKSFDVELVGKLHTTDTKDHASGHYDQGTKSEKSVIRVVAGFGRSKSADITEHEVGHHEDIEEQTVYDNFLSLNQEVKYGKHGSGTGDVGEDLVSTYAGTNKLEDIAEMVEYLFDNPRFDPEHTTIVQEKLLYVLASLEAKYPGVSALVFRNATKPEKVSAYIEKIGGAVDTARQNSRAIFVLSMLFGVAQAAEVQKNKKLVQRQKNAGLRG